jgi:hypothetical protein
MHYVIMRSVAGLVSPEWLYNLVCYFSTVCALVLCLTAAGKACTFQSRQQKPHPSAQCVMALGEQFLDM